MPSATNPIRFAMLVEINGNVVREVDANGNTIVHTFDLMNREVTKRVRMTDPARDND
jgi:hypothetical protein